MMTGTAGAAPEELGSPVFGRVLLKLSGEALMGEQPFGIDERVVAAIADCTRVSMPRFSSASCSARPLITVASIPM